MNTANQDILQSQVRRDLMKRLLGVSAAAILTPEFLLRAAQAGTVEKALMGSPVKDVKPLKLMDNIYYIPAKDKFPSPENKAFFTNIMFIDTKDGVVVIDPSASLQIGQMAIRAIKTVTQKPIIAVINTHFHGDHWMGNQAFAEAYPGIPFYSMQETATAINGALGEKWIKMALDATNNATVGTKIVAPNTFVKAGDVIDFGGTKVRFYNFGQSHTMYDLVAEVEGTPIVHVGDVMMDHRIAGMDDNEGSFGNAVKVMAKIKQTMPDRDFFLGHGRHGNARLAEQTELYETIWSGVNQALKEGKDAAAAKAWIKAQPFMIEYSKTTPEYDNSLGRWVSFAYLEAEAASF